MLKFVEKARAVSFISPRYDMTFCEISELCNEIISHRDIPRGILDAFAYGYYQGQRALRAEMKNKKM